MADRHLLLCNDDGIDAFGLRVLEEALTGLPGVRLSVVAPATQQSATSRSLTLEAPLRIRQRGARRWAVTGTPTDTVMVALGKLLADDPPDAVLAGINHGPNLGEDVHYSGTVAAAMEGCIHGLWSAALSLADWRPTDFGAAAAFVRRFLPELLEQPLPPGTLWNINLPNGAEDTLKGVRLTRQGTRKYYDVINDLHDPRGKPWVWIAGKGPVWDEAGEETDYLAIREHYASLTPLIIDLTCETVRRDLAHVAREGLPGEPVFGEDGQRFVIGGRDPIGLSFEGPTRGGQPLKGADRAGSGPS